MKKGIDVSVWQGVIDWPKVKASGVEFAMIRVGYGSSNGDSCKMDKCFKANIDGALAAGVDAGVYFYSYAKSAAAAAKEAAWVLEQLKPYSGRLTYPVAYDLEDPSQKDLGRSVLTAMVVAFEETIEDGGYYARREALKLLLDISFNTDELVLELSVLSTYEVEDDRPYKHPIPPEDQESALQYFHGILATIYTQILAEREET